MATYKLGFECKLYVGTAGTAPSTEIKGIKDVSVTMETSSVESTTRNSGKFKTYIPGQIDFGLEFKIPSDKDYGMLTTLKTQWQNRSYVSVKVDLGDNSFFQSDMMIESMSESQGNEELVEYTVSMKPSITSDSFLPQFGTETTNSSGTGGQGTPQ